MVDLENLIKFSNSGQFPNLLTISDVDNIKEITDTHNLLPSRMGILKTDTEPTKYGFEFKIPSGVEQYQLPDGEVINNKIFKYLLHEKAVFYEGGKPDVPVEEYLQYEPVPLFAPTIESLCQLATNITGNNDTSKLSELLYLLVETGSDEYDYELNTTIVSKPNKSIRIGLKKVCNATVSAEVFKYLGTRSNTKLYQSLQSASDLTSDILLDENNNAEIFVKFDSTGLVKELGYSLAPRYEKSNNQYSEGESLNKEALHTETISRVKSGSWIPSAWSEEIFTWESHYPDAVYAYNILTANADGFKVEILYGY